MDRQEQEQAILAQLIKTLGLSKNRVEYDEDGRLIRINLSGLGLTQVPVELGKLSSLQVLNLRDNELTQVPEELGQLSRLQVLNLTRNQLAQVQVELGKLSGLQELYLGSNRLTQVPEELGKLSNLQGLYLHNNHLTQVPVELGQLSNLRVLTLSDNHLQVPVELGQLSSLQRLTLSSNQLTQVPEELGRLNNLRELELNDNQLRQVPVELGQLSNLQRLTLSSNQLTQVPVELGQLSSLQELNLGANQLAQVPGELGQLSSLQKLYLSGNQLTHVPGKLGELSSLQELYLQGNQLTQIPVELGQLGSLQELYLSENQLTQVPVELGQLSSLQRLDLDNNQLTQVPVELGQLGSLQELNLGANQLAQVPGELGQLSSLQKLYLNNNQLTQVPVELEQLSRLQELYLNNNQLTQVPVELGQLSNLQWLSLEGNPDLLTPPPEIVSQGVQEILIFLRELSRAHIRRYEAKLLLVGEGGTGKSSLVRALHGEAFEAALETTHGINVGYFTLPYPPLPADALVLNTWDFGGQDIYHATHQFFLTKRSLYLVIWNARTGAQQGKLDYWLDTIRVLAPDAPVLLIATHIDERTPDLNVQQYRAAYSQIVEVLQVSSKSGEGVDEVKRALAQWACSLPLVGQPWPEAWVRVEQALLARTEHHISAQTYLDLCTAHGVDAGLAQGTLGGYLHDLGKVLYFRDDPVLSALVVLKPNWVTKAISLVLEDEVIRRNGGIVAHADLPRIWARDEQGMPYARTLYPIFLRLMERFDLSYQIDPMVPGLSPTHSLVPQLLPYEPPVPLLAWPAVSENAGGQLHVEMVYRFDFVPAGIMSWMLVRTHRYTTGQHWREGALLRYQEHVARIELVPMRRELRLVVWGVQPYTFFVILKETLDLILTRFPGLQVRREVPCICHLQRGVTEPCSEVYRYEEDLVRRLEHDKETLECPKSFQNVSVLQLLYGIHPRSASQMMVKVEEGQRQILQQLTVLQRHDTLLLQIVLQSAEWNVRNFTRLWNLEMQRQEVECPNAFFLRAGSPARFNPKNWMSHNYKVLLMCQHPPAPHSVDERYAYDLRQPREWWVKVSPWLKYLITFLKYGVPFGGALGDVINADALKSIEAEIKLLEEITNDLADVVESDPLRAEDAGVKAGPDRVVGSALRVLYSFLKEADPHQLWGELQRVVTPDGNILWLCPEHAKPFEVHRLQIGV